MSNVNKPNPIVEFRVCSMGIEHEVIFTDETTHLDSGHYTAIETSQAEAYAAERVREASEQAAKTVESRHKEVNVSDARYQLHKIHGKSYSALIRALITKE